MLRGEKVVHGIARLAVMNGSQNQNVIKEGIFLNGKLENIHGQFMCYGYDSTYYFNHGYPKTIDEKMQ